MSAQRTDAAERYTPVVAYPTCNSRTPDIVNSAWR
ncbi:UNVERIFIED_ORG: hypothetical protein ABIC72_003943 [Burkholderia sp. 1988]|nr:hypothetical protein [Paraburkholderia terricola]